MTKLTYNLFLILLIGFATSVNAAEPIFKQEFTREIHETFDVSPGVNLGVQNKYGNININTWDKNQIQIDVLMKVKSSNSEKAQKFLNAIQIDFQSSSSEVIARTVYPEQNNSSWWSNWFGNNKNIDYEVHYTINAPSEMNTELINKYGNISQNSIDGASDVTNKYGNIDLKNISESLSLELGYGNATVGDVGSNTKVQMKYSSIKMLNVEDINISTKYSDIKIKTCDNMVSHSKYDEFTIETIGTLKNDGKYDEFNIGTVNALNIDTKYTDINIRTLQQKAIFDTGYGNVNIQATGNNLEKLVIHSKYTEFEFSIDGDFHLDFEGSRSDLHVNKPYEKYDSHKDGSDIRIKAYRGSKDGGTQIIADMRYGGLDIN